MSITHGLGQAYIMMWCCCLYNMTNFSLFMDDVANLQIIYVTCIRNVCHLCM